MKPLAPRVSFYSSQLKVSQLVHVCNVVDGDTVEICCYLTRKGTSERYLEDFPEIKIQSSVQNICDGKLFMLS